MSPPGETFGGGSQEADGPNLNETEESCFTEAELKKLGLVPVPEWARKPPKAKTPGLFDDENGDDSES